MKRVRNLKARLLKWRMAWKQLNKGSMPQAV